MSDADQTMDAARKRDPRLILERLASQESDAPPKIALKIARAKAALGDIRGAADTLARAIARHPADLALVQHCAGYRLKLGETAAALELLAPHENEATPEMALMLARARQEESGAGAAAATLASALERHPANAGLAVPCAKYFLKEGDAAGAVATLLPFEDKLSADNVLLLSRALSDAGDSSRSEAVAVRGLERFPDQPDLTGQLAEICLQGGRWREALALLSQIEAVASPQRLLMLAQALQSSGQSAAALASLERAAERYPADAAILQRLVKARCQAGNTSDALILLDRLPEPRAESWYLTRAEVLETIGDPAGFEATIRQGLAAFPGAPALLTLLTRAIAPQNKSDETADIKAAIESSVIANPKNLAEMVSACFVHGAAQGAADLISRLVSQLEAAPLDQSTVRGLTELIPGARMLLPDIGIPLLKRILARVHDCPFPLSVQQLILVATAHGVVGDDAGLRQHILELTPKLDTSKYIIEALALSAWINDEREIAALEERFRLVLDNEQRSTIAPSGTQLDAQTLRVFSVPELGTCGFAAGESDAVAFVFNGPYNLPGEIQQKFVSGLLARGTHVVRLLDMRRDVYLSGIGPFAGGRNESVATLKAFIAQRGYRRSICVGVSGGGLPAGLYGDAIGADRVVAFSPPVFLPPDGHPMLRRALALVEKIRKPGLDVDTDLLEIWNRPGRHPKLEIHYPAAHAEDAPHALRMKAAPGVTLYPAQTGRHDFYAAMSADELAACILGSP